MQSDNRRTTEPASTHLSVRCTLAAALLLASAGSGASAQQGPVGPFVERAGNQAQAGEQLWQGLAGMPAGVQQGRAWIRPAVYRAYALDFAGLQQLLGAAPLEFSGRQRLTIALPNPRGEFSYFEIAQSPVMAPALEAWMDGQGAVVRTFVGQGLDDPTATIRLDYTPSGFHAFVLGAGDGQHSGNWAIDPYTFGDVTHYGVYDIDKTIAQDVFVCHVGPDFGPPDVESPFEDRQTGGTLRVYDMAVAAVPSYTNFHGGTVAGAQAAIVTTVNRLNQIYERDFAVRFQLVANNQNLIYTTANPGPYTDGNLSLMLDENQTNINSVIGSANYDIGHVFSGQNLGGLAQRPAVCLSGKARGGTGLSNPSGDFFNVKYVGHEVGHQFNASHSFNADDSAGSNVCLPNRSSTNAYEPGSGSTIMSYQGLCGASNNLPNWDTQFNQGSYAQVVSHITGSGNCGTNTSTGNNLPNINPIAAFSIPIGTAFSASASVTDADGDNLTYSWEQRNLGPAQPETGAGSEDNGQSPLFRVFAPSSSNTRIFPNYPDVLDGTVAIGEQYPGAARTLTLRLMVRDNRAGFGAVRTGDVNYTVVGTAGPFAINVLNSGTNTIGPGSYTLTWDVANTTAAPISTSTVRILLSTDSGQTWPTVLAASTPNDGTETLTLPAIISSTVRFRIEPTNSVYFDVNNVDVRLACPPVPNVQATDSTRCSDVRVTWDAVPGATSYRVFRNTSNNSATATQLSASVVGTSFDNTSAVAGTQYWFWVRVNSSLCTGGGPFSTPDTGTRAANTALTLNPSNQSVASGATASFSVAATGTSLSYQWQRGGVNLPSDPRYAGINAATLTISNAQPGDQGSYRCIVSGLCGASVTSGVATLTVTTGPTCDSIDFNNDNSSFDPQDIEAFLSVYGEGPCIPAAASCNDIDFNNDNSVFDPCDISSFLTLYGEGPCTPCGV